MANLTIRLDDEDKKGLSEFCDQAGLSISEFFNIYIKQVLREGRIPFEIAVDCPNRTTIKAMMMDAKISKNICKSSL